MLLTRVLSALVLIPFVLALLYLGGLPLLLLVLAAAGLGYYEFYAMFRRAGQPPFLFVGLAVALAAVAVSYFPRADLAPALLTAALLLTLAYSLLRLHPLQQVAADWALTLAGALYVGWLLRYAFLLRMLPAGWESSVTATVVTWPGCSLLALTCGGWEWSLTALAATWAADTGAFLTGRAIGRHKVCPHISPGKTWEGVAGGFALTIIAALLAGAVLLGLAVWQGLLLGLLIAAAAVVGDLAESLLKRAAGVKDSGALIPGHGGLLDRIDSILFVLPAVYYFHVWIVS